MDDHRRRRELILRESLRDRVTIPRRRRLVWPWVLASVLAAGALGASAWLLWGP